MFVFKKIIEVKHSQEQGPVNKSLNKDNRKLKLGYNNPANNVIILQYSKI